MEESEKQLGNILIIDDDVDISNLMKIKFKRQGHRVHVLNQPKGYLNEIEDKEINVVLLDIMMPGVNGLQVLKKISVIL